MLMLFYYEKGAVMKIFMLLLLMLAFTARSEHIRQANVLLHIAPTNNIALPLSPTEKNYLSNKHQLRLGLLTEPSPPWRTQNYRGEFEGVSIDYSAIIADRLGLSLEAYHFGSLSEAKRALARGEIDLLADIDVTNCSSRFLCSSMYTENRPIIAVKKNQHSPIPADLADMEVAIAVDYLALENVQHTYPKARIRLYSNTQAALSAVAYGNKQVFLGGSETVGYNDFDGLRTERYALLPENKIGYLLNDNRQLLVSLINRAIASLTRSEIASIQQFWQPELLLSGENSLTLVLSDNEKKWISAHPQVNALIYDNNYSSPLAFVDDSGEIHGLAADILRIVELHTGIKFSFQRMETVKEMMDAVSAGNADLLSALVSSKPREPSILFTRQYITSPFALLTHKETEKIQHLADLRGKKLALIRGTSVADMVQKNYPNINIYWVESDKALLDSVAKRKADAGIMTLIFARYQINRHYHEQLKVVNTAGMTPAFISFAVGKHAPELRDIIDKVMMTIPPGQMNLLASRWRPESLVVHQSFWQKYQTWILFGMGLSALLIFFSLIWLFHLRRQVILRTRIQRQLDDQLTLLRQMVDGTPFPVWLRDRHGALTYCNQRYLAETASDWLHVKGTTLLEYQGNLTREEAVGVHQLLQQVIEQGKARFEDRNYQLQHQNGDQDSCTVFQWLQPWLDSEGNTCGVMGGWMDISNRQALLLELREMRDKAEASNRAKSTFLSTMSHEIRTPLNAVIGMLDMAIRQMKMGQQDLQALELAHDSAQSLIGLIGDVLDISRIEGGYHEFHPERVNLRSLVEKLRLVFGGVASEKNLQVVLQLSGDSEQDVEADPLRIKQILTNLLSNAIKYSDRGCVLLRLEQNWNVDLNQVHCVIEVEDNGIGIPLEQQAALFQPFAQAENRRAGTGLGLYISRNLCQAMQGSLTLRSQPGEGTCARAEFYLPAAVSPPAPEDMATAVTAARTKLTVLVVDDNHANRLLLSRQLTWLGHECETVGSATEALAQWHSEKFDVIITDCNMPVMNGYQLAAAIRLAEQKKSCNPVWIIGFTASALHEVSLSCKQAGMNDCLFKPCSLNAIAEALQKSLIV